MRKSQREGVVGRRSSRILQMHVWVPEGRRARGGCGLSNLSSARPPRGPPFKHKCGPRLILSNDLSLTDSVRRRSNLRFAPGHPAHPPPGDGGWRGGRAVRQRCAGGAPAGVRRRLPHPTSHLTVASVRGEASVFPNPVQGCAGDQSAAPKPHPSRRPALSKRCPSIVQALSKLCPSRSHSCPS